jgi:glycerol kinase
MSYLLALDQGTTSSRAIVFDSSGRIVQTSQKEFNQLYPQAGWVEHDPNEIWLSQIEVVQQALVKCHLAPRSVVTAGITNKRETTVLWDRRTGEPVYNAIVWLDRRTAGYCDELRRAGAEAEVQSRTGLLLDPYFSGTKLHWILNNVPGARDRAEAGELAFGTVDSWLIWKLTGGAVHATDPQ